MRAGFIGLGTLGTAMASRLIAEGVDLTVWNRTGRKMESLKAARAASPAEVTSREEVIILNLFDSDAVAAVLTGPAGVLQESCSGKIFVDTSTNHAGRVEEFHRMVHERGAHYLESPVLGSVAPALQGALTILASADRQTFDAALPFLEKIGKTIVYLGAPGLATKMKLINNMVLASFMSVLAEAIVLGEAAGVARRQIIEILGSGAGNSGVLNAKKEKLVLGEYSPQFSTAAIYKDLRYVESLGPVLGRPLIHAPLERELFARAVDAGYGERDFSSILEVLNAMSDSRV